MNFAYPQLLYLLLLIPIIFGVFWLGRLNRRRKLARYGDPAHLAALMPEASRYKPYVKITVELLALACLVIAVARPRGGQREEVENTQGIEVMIAFDVSRSMLASSNDDPAGISRIQRAKYLLGRLIDRLNNDKVGLIVFAGEAYTQLPITTDFVSARMYLNEISTDMVSTQGTAIGTAISMAVNSFSTDDNDISKAIIVITDGENHEGDATEMAAYAKSLGIEVDIIGVGSTKGAPIPINARRGEYLKDNEGKPVTTYLNEQMGRDIAKDGGGIYINGSAKDAVDVLLEHLDELQKGNLKQVSYKASAEQFPIFAWLALILLVIDATLMDSKTGWLKRFNFFSK